MNITKALGFFALLNLAGCIHAQTKIDWPSQIRNIPTDFAYTDMIQTWTAQQNFGVITSTGATITGASFLQNLVVPNGGYAQFPPLTYNPYGGSICVDKWGNVVTQPVPVTGATFGPEDVVLWNSTSPSMPFQNGTGSGLVQPVLYTNPASTNTGSCGIPLPVNTTYGLNTNGYFFGRAGLGTDLPAYNSIQSLQGGMTANSYTAGVLYPAGTLVCTTVVAGVCTMTTALVVPTYLGGHMDIGHSCGPPMAGSIAAATNPFSGGEGFVQGMVYWDDCLHYALIRTDSSTWVRLNSNGGSASGGPTNSFQINDGSGGFIGYSALTYNSGTNIVTMTGTAGQGMIAPLFNANAGSTNLEFQGTNFSVKGDGHLSTNGWIELGGRTAPAVSAAGNAAFYYNSANQEIYFSYAGGAYTGLRAPVFNGVVTGLGGGAKTFQNSDGSFTIDYQGNAAFQSLALNHGLTVDSGMYGLDGSGVLTVASCVGCGGGGGGSPSLPINSVQYNKPAGTFKGNSNFLFDDTTGALSVCTVLGGICTVTSGVDAQAFSSSATGTAVGFTDVGANFTIKGNGEGDFQNLAIGNATQMTISNVGTMATTGTITATNLATGGGSYGLNNSGTLTVAAVGASAGISGLSITATGGGVLGILNANVTSAVGQGLATTASPTWNTITANSNINAAGIITADIGNTGLYGFEVGMNVGVSCSGSPTVSFASVRGIVTHC